MSNAASLAEIIDAWPPSKDTIDDLREKLTGVAVILLVAFVGAGLATDMGFPGWSAFLRKLAGVCGKTDEGEALLSAFQYE